jgi:hypothetical protein
MAMGSTTGATTLVSSNCFLSTLSISIHDFKTSPYSMATRMEEIPTHSATTHLVFADQTLCGPTIIIIIIIVGRNQ